MNSTFPPEQSESEPMTVTESLGAAKKVTFTGEETALQLMALVTVKIYEPA